MKRFTAILFALVLVFTAALIPAGAAGSYGVVLDDSADLLNENEEAQLTVTLSEVSDKCKCNVAFVTAHDLSSASFDHNNTAEDYAKGYFNAQFGAYSDGVIVFLVESDEIGSRNLCVFGSGKCEKRLSDSESEDIRQDAITYHNPDSSGYYDFFNSIADGLMKAIPPHLKWYMLPLAILIGFVIALIIALIIRSGLKTVRPERGAVNYVRSGSMNVTAARDTYLYSTVSRTARPKNNSSHSGSSSSGGSFSGGSSRF